MIPIIIPAHTCALNVQRSAMENYTINGPMHATPLHINPVLLTLFYNNGVSVLTQKQQQQLLTLDKKFAYSMVGYSSWTGELSNNQRLSRWRAIQVASFLSLHGFSVCHSMGAGPVDTLNLKEAQCVEIRRGPC